MTPVPILLYGATGRMGRAIRECLPEFPEVELRACVAPNRGEEPCPEGCAWMAPSELVSVGEARLPSDVVVIDVSLAEGTALLLDWLERVPRALVSATTGLSVTLEARIRLLADRAPVLRARNLSVGNSVASAMLRAVPEAAREALEVDVIEHHHAAKRDAPSGTALAWASVLAGGKSELVRAAPANAADTRVPGEIRVHSIRSGTAIGTHRALFAGAGETLEIVHTVFDRAVFARGALRAARFLYGRAPRAYSFDDVLSRS